MNRPEGTVFVVDDVQDVRTALARLLTSADYRIRLFNSAEHFLEEQDCAEPGCLLLDICLPGLNGIELQRSLFGSPNARPIVFLTGMADIQASVNAMKAGAVDFLTKPIDKQRMFAALEEAMRRDAKQRQERALRGAIQQRLEALTPRERQVMEGVVHGRLNKQIAAELGTGEKTVKVHRGRLMSKMGVRSVAELVLLGARVGVTFDIPLDVGTAGANWQRVGGPRTKQVERIMNRVGWQAGNPVNFTQL